MKDIEVENEKQNCLPYRARFVFGVVLPNIGLATLLILYLYCAGYFAEFSKISGASGSGPGAGTGTTLLAAIMIFLFGFASVGVFLLIPSLIATILSSTRKWSNRRNVFLAGVAICALIAALYYILTFVLINSIRT